MGQELGKDFAVEAQYLGSQSNHIETAFDYNYAPPGTAALSTRAPFPQYDRIYGFSSGAAANYHAMLLSAKSALVVGFHSKARTLGPRLSR